MFFQTEIKDNLTYTTGAQSISNTTCEGWKNDADVLIITQSGGIGFDHMKSNSFSYDTLVTNPDIYASNVTTTIYHTARFLRLQ